jgi:hypothetical protein
MYNEVETSVNGEKIRASCKTPPQPLIQHNEHSSLFISLLCINADHIMLLSTKKEFMDDLFFCTSLDGGVGMFRNYLKSRGYFEFTTIFPEILGNFQKSRPKVRWYAMEISALKKNENFGEISPIF